MKPLTILCDLDHTVSDAKWRDHLLKGQMTSDDWDEYHKQSMFDAPIYSMLETLYAYRKLEKPIVGITGRPEKWRKLSLEWLYKYHVPMDDLLMRPDGCFFPNAEMKVMLAKEAFGPDLRSEIFCLYDDNEKTIEAFHAEGVRCYLAYGNERQVK